MDPDEDLVEVQFNSVPEISDNGERVSHLHKDCGYYAHLSIYDFAVQYCKDALVLDAGSGAGYGSAYLADEGAAHVWGIDASERAIAFSRYHFQRSNLTFQEMNLEDIKGFSPRHIDLVYSSNTLEHVPDVAKFMRQSWNLLKLTGTLIVAVPPITDDRLQYLNIINPYHVNIWTPRQWAFVLGCFFEEVTPVLHGVEKLGMDFKPEHFTEASPLNEQSFEFALCEIEDMYNEFTLTAIFVVRKPRSIDQLPAEDAPISFIDESFTRPQGYIDPAIRQKLKKYFDMPTPPYVLPASETTDKLTLSGMARRILTSVGRALPRGKP